MGVNKLRNFKRPLKWKKIEEVQLQAESLCMCTMYYVTDCTALPVTGADRELVLGKSYKAASQPGRAGTKPAMSLRALQPVYT